MRRNVIKILLDRPAFLTEEAEEDGILIEALVALKLLLVAVEARQFAERSPGQDVSRISRSPPFAHDFRPKHLFEPLKQSLLRLVVFVDQIAQDQFQRPDPAASPILGCLQWHR